MPAVAVEVRSVKGDGRLARAACLAEAEMLDGAAVERVKRAIETRLDRPVTLEATVAIKR